MNSDDWMQPEIARLTAKYGAVPPPWVVFPDTHPYDICWRMAAGESHIVVWGAWWDAQRMDETARIAYFRKWPPPPRWLGWMVDAIWDVESSDDAGEDADYLPYYERAEALGFGSRNDYERDLDDPKWIGQ